MNDKKVFRVYIKDTINYYYDVEAENLNEALQLTEVAIKDNDTTFSEDYDADYKGYQVSGGRDIERSKSDLA